MGVMDLQRYIARCSIFQILINIFQNVNINIFKNVFINIDIFKNDLSVDISIIDMAISLQRTPQRIAAVLFETDLS